VRQANAYQLSRYFSENIRRVLKIRYDKLKKIKNRRTQEYQSCKTLVAQFKRTLEEVLHFAHVRQSPALLVFITHLILLAGAFVAADATAIRPRNVCRGVASRAGCFAFVGGSMCA